MKTKQTQMDKDNIEQKFLNLSHRLVVIYGSPEQIKDLETWALPHALQNAILFEEQI